MDQRAGGIFRSRTFSLFYVGQAFSYLGDGLRTIAIPLLVYHLTGSALSLSTTYALEFLPFAVFGLFGGSFADRVDRRRLMLGCDALRFLVIVIFAVAYARNALSLPMLYCGIGVLSVAAAFFCGGQASSIPFVLGKDRATAAMSALIATEQSTQLIAPPVGGAIFALVGPLPALLANAVTYLISQASLMVIPTLGPERTLGIPHPSHVLRDIRDGFRLMLADHAMRAYTVIHGFINFFGLMAFAVYIPFLKREFGASDQTIGISLGILALGSVAGSLAAGATPRGRRFGRLITTAYIVDAISFLPVIFTHHLWVAIAFTAISNGLVTFELTHILGWRMRIIPEEFVGRVFGVVRFIAMCGIVPGMLIAGFVGDHAGTRVALFISESGYMLVAIIACLTPVVRNEAR